MSVDDRAAEVFARTPINDFLKLSLVHRSRDRVEVHAKVSAAQTQEYGVIQGGIIGALADTAAVYLIIPDATDAGARVSGVEFKINFMRPATPDGGDLVAIASPVKIGRRIAVCAVDVMQGDAHVARATFTYLVAS